MPSRDGETDTYIEKSRFICHVFRVFTVEEAQAHIQRIKKLHSKANHNCVAYQIGNENEIQRAFDDGEPTGTAGIPMLDVLKRRDVRNCLLIITRYFGGVKLGAGGLIRAYGSCASNGLETVGLTKRVKLQSVWLICDYDMYDLIISKIKQQNKITGSVTYGAAIEVEVLVESLDVESFVAYIKETTHERIQPVVGEFSFKEIPV